MKKIILFLVLFSFSSATEVFYEFAPDRIVRANITQTKVSGGWNFTLVSFTQPASPVGAGLALGIGHRLGVGQFSFVGETLFISDASVISHAPWGYAGIYYFGGVTATSAFQISFDESPADQPQIITANALTGTAFKNSPITGTATGKTAGSTYRLIITSATGGGSINSETGAYVLNPSATGHLTFQISATASAGFLESNILNGDYFVNESNKFKYSIPFNDGQFAIRYELWQSGVMVGSTTVQPNQGGTVATIDLGANSGGVEMRSFVLGVMSDGVNTITEVGSETLQQVKTYTPQQVETPTTQTLTAPPVTAATASTPTAISERSGTVWSKPTTTATGTDKAAGEGDGVTNQVYREGVVKLVDKLEQIEISKTKEKEAAQKAASDSLQTADASGSSAAASLAATIPTAGAFPSGPSISSGGAQDFTVRFPAIFGGLIVDLDPLREDRLGPTAAWLRGAFYWLTIVGFGYWASTRVGDWVKGASQLQQTRGNTVAGTGGQLTAALGAAIIVVTISTFIVALVGYLAGEFSLSAILAKISVNPMAGYSAKALYLLDGVFPIATIITALVARISWNLYASSTFAGAMAFIRFVNP